MPDFSAITLATMQRQLGLITSDQLDTGGIHRTTRQRLVDQRILERPYKSVYMVTTRRPTFEQRLIALSLAHPTGFITGPTAGGYLGLRRMPRSSRIHLCLPHPIHISEPAGVLLRQSTRVGPYDVRVLENGMRIASWARLLFDLSADLTKTNLTSVIDQVIRAGDASIEELGAIAIRLCHPTRRGSELFQRTLMERGNRKPVDSHPELMVMNGLVARGVPVEPQDELRLPNGKQIRIDLAVPAVRWAVEVDIHPAHNQPAGIVSDKQRDRQLHLIDWQVERVTDEDLQNPDALFDEPAGLYRRRASSLAA